MRARNRLSLLALASLTLTLGACGGAKDNASSTTPATGTATYQHHSVLGGAVAGAAAGHVLGKHAIAGAAVGALVQHERNKHAAAAAH